jgi:tyrosine decarboxylase / aspartate 1-decarboxylase
MRIKGLGKAELAAILKLAQAKDLRYKDGKILCSMCTSPLPAANLARKMFSESNIGDSGLFPGSAQLEKEAIASLSNLLHGPASAAGFIVSGGTEANLMALYAARNTTGVTAPEVVVPESAHFSFDKICDMLKIKLVKASLDEAFRVDPADVETKINPRTIAIVGNAGSAELGAVDPVAELSKIALKFGVPLHVDAAFGGLVLPFLKELGYATENFDFSLAGVQSITVDPHKMGFAPIPAGGILFRDVKHIQCIRTDTPYLTEPYQCTFVGTRSGASVAAVWAVFESLGREGFKKNVKRCMNATAFLCEELEATGFKVLVSPVMNIVGFRSTNSKQLVSHLRQRGWYVSYVPRLDCVRVVLMPHIRKRHIKEFLQVLREIINA